MNQPSMPDLPPYTYVPGVTPHPISDLAGHMRQDSDLPADWTREQYLKWGLELFNTGYYWESHEVWEHLWIELSRTTPEARAVQGMIKLAACGVKCLEGNSNGARRHAARSVELLTSACESPLFAELSLTRAHAAATAASQSPPLLPTKSTGTPTILAGFVL